MINFLISPAFANHREHCGTATTAAEFRGCAEFLFGNLVAILITVAGIAFFFMIVAAGFRYLTSGGDPKALASAANTLTWAVAGFLLVLVSWFILILIVRLTGVPVFFFQVGL